MKRQEKWIFLFCVLMISFSISVFALGSGGFENASLGAKALGQGNAFVAESDDPSAVAFNPAGLTELPEFQIQVGAALLNPHTTFQGHDDGAAYSERGRVDLAGTPNFYATYQTPFFNRRLSLGFGLTAPFGLVSEYSSTGDFRYLGFHNELVALGYSMETAFRLTDWASIGAGVTYYDTSAKLYQAVPLALLGGSGDGLAKLEARGGGWGWNLGVKIKPRPKHTIGVFYRSPVRTQVRGHVNISNIDPTVVGLGYFPSTSYETGAHTDIKYPESVTVGYMYEPTNKWKLETDLCVTNWRVFDRQAFVYDAPTSGMSILDPGPVLRDFKPSLSVNVGTSYQLSDKLTGRIGYIFYQTPQTEGNFRPDIADSNRSAPTIGLSWDNKKMSIDLAYAAIFYHTRNVNNDVGTATSTPIDGQYKTFINEFMLSCTIRDFSVFNNAVKKILPFNQSSK